ncbi:hypothetical protein HZF02_10085 [Pseudomonas yamanorum]|nr:hypothetical protein HZF02_10085 [Pseudomonas yamanorum]
MNEEDMQYIVSDWAGPALELFECIHAVAIKAALQGLSPKQIANEAVQEITCEMGGRVIYIARGHRYSQAQRNKEIYELWKYHNRPVSVLAKKYKLASASVYEIIASFAKLDGLEKSKNKFIK